jgi:hypothetical protein
MTIGSIGDATACGDNPCTWLDDIYVRDACLAYLTCEDPSNLLVIGADQGAIAAAGAAVGQTTGRFFSNAADQTLQNSSIPGTLVMIALAVGGFFVAEALLKK